MKVEKVIDRVFVQVENLRGDWIDCQSMVSSQRKKVIRMKNIEQRKKYLSSRITELEGILCGD